MGFSTNQSTLIGANDQPQLDPPNNWSQEEWDAWQGKCIDANGKAPQYTSIALYLPAVGRFVDELSEKLSAGIKEAIESASETVLNMKINASKDIYSCLENAESLCEKIRGKYNKEIIKRIGNAYDAAIPIGYQVPDQDTLDDFEETGNLSPIDSTPDVIGERFIPGGGPDYVPVELIPSTQYPPNAKYLSPVTHFFNWGKWSIKLQCESDEFNELVITNAKLLGMAKALAGDYKTITAGEYDNIYNALKSGQNGLSWMPDYVNTINRVMVDPDGIVYLDFELPVTVDASKDCNPSPSGNGQIVVGNPNEQQQQQEQPQKPKNIGQQLLDAAKKFSETSQGERPIDIKPGKVSFADLLKTFKPPDWGSLNVCNVISTATKVLTDSGFNLPEYFGISSLDDPHPKLPPDLAKWMEGFPTPIKGFFWRTIYTGLKWIGDIAEAATSASSCDIPGMVIPGAIRMILGFVNGYVGGALDGVMQSYDKWIDYECPSDIPSVGEAHEARLNGTINDELWKCWVRSNNVHEKPARKILEAGRTKPNIGEVISLYRRGIIGGDDYKKKAGEAGILSQEDLTMLEEVSRFIPGPSDLVTFMTRDSADEEVAKKYDYDFEFDKKFTGKVKEWAKAQAIDADVFKYIWRAHWQIPSPTQLFEMLHRLRPGRVAPELVTTAADIKEALEVNDMAPGWVKKVMAISYNVITRTDAWRAFKQGSIDGEELYNVFLDIGYTEDSAKILRKFYTDLKLKQSRSKSGMRTVNQNVKDFVDGYISQDELQKALLAMGIDFANSREIIQDAINTRNVMDRKTVIKSMKKQFMTGGLTKQDVFIQLSEYLSDPDRARYFADTWAMELLRGPKEVPAGMLCKWFTKRLINEKTYLIRLKRIGYSEADATNIIAECRMTEEERLKKEAEKKADAAKKEQEKKKKEMDKQNKGK